MATVRFLGGGRGDGDGRRSHGEPAPSRKPEAPVRADREAKTSVELPAIPEKIYFRIGEVAHLVGVEPHVLRYWEHEFRSIRPTKSQRGQRVYSRRDVEHLRRIRSLLYEQGFTIAGAKKALRARGVEPREENDPTLVAGNRAREALVAIRNDVEAFLRELGG
jgi:DNA-binding transcriptional MerR regulator